MPSARLAARMDSLFSFPVGLLHPLQHAGFDPGAPKLGVKLSLADSCCSNQSLTGEPVKSFPNQLRSASRWTSKRAKIPVCGRPIQLETIRHPVLGPTIYIDALTSFHG